MIRVIRWHDLAELPWKNGGGTTREIYRHPAEGDFDWRVSVAEVATPGPFSMFPGYDRIIMPLTPHGMRLTMDDAMFQDLVPLVPFGFAGELPLAAELPYGPVTDFNFMVRRSTGSGSLSMHHLKAGDAVTLPASAQLVFVVAGRLQACGETLEARDSLLSLAAAGQPVTGAGTMACCHYAG